MQVNADAVWLVRTQSQQMIVACATPAACTLTRARLQRSPEILPVTGGAHYPAFVHDCRAADDGSYRPTFQRPAIVEAVVGIGAQLRGVDHTLSSHVDERQVGVA